VVLLIVLALAAIPLLMVTVDPTVGRYMAARYESPSVQPFLDSVDPLGRAPLIGGIGVLLLGAAVLARSKQLARVGVLVLLTFALCGGAVYSLKVVVRRPRPWVAYLHHVSWSTTQSDWNWARDGGAHSFPAGDATCAAGLATVLFLAVGRGRARYALFLIYLLSAAGRVVGARHYPSDCLAALVLGASLAALAWRLWPEPKSQAPRIP